MTDWQEPRMRHHKAKQASYVETWWTVPKPNGLGSERAPIKSDNLAPVRLPEGLEVTIASMIRHLPDKP